MPGCGYGFSVNMAATVASEDPFDTEILRPDELARALERALTNLTIKVAGSADHKITDAHVYQVGATLSSLRRKLGLPTPWVGANGRVKPLAKRKATRRRRR